MKNFIEIPRKEDYHNTTFVDVQQAGREPQHEKEMLLYHKGRINLRSIVDLHEWAIKIDVIDEEKYPEWEKQRAEWTEKNKARMKVVPMPMPEPNAAMLEDRSGEVCERPGEYAGIGEAVNMYPFGSPPMPPPPTPTKTKTIKVTSILYFSGVQRFIVDDYKDFCGLYDNYLTAQKLDFDIPSKD